MCDNHTMDQSLFERSKKSEIIPSNKIKKAKKNMGRFTLHQSKIAQEESKFLQDWLDAQVHFCLISHVARFFPIQIIFIFSG